MNESAVLFTKFAMSSDPGLNQPVPPERVDEVRQSTMTRKAVRA
jgi:hypothetical protein